MKNDKIKLVTRAGGLVETNSSSSHAISICSKSDSLAKPGDPEFDLDIRDNILYVPERQDTFGWEYEKTNSCQTKLQYVCGLVFNTWTSLCYQKAPKRLESLLKRYLGVSKVVFEWEIEYLKSYKDSENQEEEIWLGCPEIDHQSRGDSMEEILESNSTILNFIFNKKSWLFGGNDNSSAPAGYYREMSLYGNEVGEFDEIPNATVSIFYGGKLGRIDFRVNIFSDKEGRSDRPDSPRIVEMIENSDDFGLFKNISYSSEEKDFVLCDMVRGYSDVIYSAEVDYINSDNKCYLIYLNKDGIEMLVKFCKKELEERQDPHPISELLKDIPDENKILVPVSLVSDEFGEIYVH